MTRSNCTIVAAALAAHSVPPATAQFGGFDDPVFLQTVRASDIAVADVTGDGIPDIVATRQSTQDNQIRVLRGVGDGTFALHHELNSGDVANHIAVGDIDRDGDLDLVTSTRVLFNNGNGIFSGATAYDTVASGGQPLLADVDGVNGPDVISSGPNLDDDLIRVLYNDGAGGFTASEDFPLPAAVSGTINIRADDLNNDGRPDIVYLPDLSDPSYAILLNNGAGGFGAAQVTEVVGARGTTGLDTADLDGDGDIDFVTAENGRRRLFRQFNDGSGSFTQQPYLNLNENADHVELADIDGDLDNDIVFMQGVLGTRLNNGDGTFGARQFFGFASSVSRLVIADTNEDLAPDAVIGIFNEPSGVGIFGNLTDALPPGDFALLAPADAENGIIPPRNISGPGQSIRLVFDWSRPTSFEVTYNVTIATDPDLLNPVFERQGVAQTHLEVPESTLEIATRYYWGVLAVNQAGSTPSTPPSQTFTTVCPADVDGIYGVNSLDFFQFLDDFVLGCPD